MVGTALYALPPAIVATGYLEHRDAERRAKMVAFEKLFEKKRLMILRHAASRLRSRARQATSALRAAVRMADMRRTATNSSPSGDTGDAIDAELLAAMQQAGSGDLSLTIGRGSHDHAVRRTAMASMAGSAGTGPGGFPPTMRALPTGPLRLASTRSFRMPPRVIEAAKSLLLACKGDLSSGVRALTEAERWAATADAAEDDTSLPDLVRLQTRGRGF